MLKINYEKTFVFAKAYAQLGIRERSVIEYLFEKDVFKGGYSSLARKLNYDVSNLRKTLKHLKELGVIYIGYNKYDDELEIKKNKNLFMKYCFIVDGWMDLLIQKYESETNG